jgi:hypothetical protein
MPNARMHIHSSNPVNIQHFCNQFLPRNSAEYFSEIRYALKLSSRMPIYIAYFMAHAVPQGWSFRSKELEQQILLPRLHATIYSQFDRRYGSGMARLTNNQSTGNQSANDQSDRQPMRRRK